MPDLNIKGNIIDNFGTFLPTPIIDSVAIYNDKIRINLSLFFNFTDLDITDDEIDDYLEYLSNTTTGAPLYVYGAYILGQSYIDSILNKNNIDIMTELYGAKIAQFEQEDSSWADSTYANNGYKIFEDANDFVRSDQNFYDNADNKVIQYGGFIELPIEIGGKALSITDLDKNIFLASEPIVDTLHDMSVFAFTSWLALPGAPTDTFTGDTSSVPYIANIVDDGNRKFTSLKIDLLPPLAEQQFSNISYAGVFKGGHADVEPKVHFIDENEVFYNKTPIQVIDGKYYKQDAYTLEQIVALFESYISSHKMAGEDNEDVKSVLNNIAYVLSLYGDTTQLLIELNKLRQTFPEKSSATEVGSLYAGFKDRFFGANEKVAAGTPVVEKLVRTSKIRDLRDLDTSDWVPPIREPQELILASPSNGGLISSQVLYTQDNTYDGSSPGDYFPPEADAEAYVKNGFWFFNYEQALKRYANATGILSLDTLYKYAGKDVVRANFKLTSATMIKWVYDPNYTGIEQPIEDLDNSIPIDTDHMNMVATLKTDIEYNSDDIWTAGIVGPRSVSFVLTDEVGNQTSLSDYKSVLSLNFGIGVHESDQTVGSYTSFLALRGIDAFSDSQVGKGYQLVAFNFQDVEESYSTAEQNEVYSFQVEVTDTTKSMAMALLYKFASYYDNELTEYYDYASENCNYNNVDGAFNEFFTEGVMTYYKDKYSTDKREYPWVTGPIYYNLFREILTDFFGGDEQKLVDDATAISAKINPINGTLENLTAFYENFGAFLAANFAAASGGMSLTEYLDDMDTETVHTFGENHDVQYYPIPTPVPIVPELVVVIDKGERSSGEVPDQLPECASRDGTWKLQNSHMNGSTDETSHHHNTGEGFVVFLSFGTYFTGQHEGEAVDYDSRGDPKTNEYRTLQRRLAHRFVGWESSTSGYPYSKFDPIVTAITNWVEAHDTGSTGSEISAWFYYTDEAAHTGDCVDSSIAQTIDGLSNADLAAVAKPNPVRVGDQKIKCKMDENPPLAGSNRSAYVKCKQYIYKAN